LSGYCLRARVYSPASGRFVSRDPLTLNAFSQPVEPNLYWYVGNDPSGLDDGLPIQWWPPVGPNPPLRLPPPVQPPNRTPNPWTWAYGRWCGVYRCGPGEPIDAIDRACWRHDRCVGPRSFGAAWRFWGCAVRLCSDARAAYYRGCGISWAGNPTARAACERAAADIMLLFCIGQHF